MALLPVSSEKPVINTTFKIVNKTGRTFHASNLTELATEALRQGMTWSVYRPEHGVYLAEGNGCVLRNVRQAGLTFEYINDPQIHPRIPDERYIESPVIDKLFFGILPGQRSLGLPDYPIGTISEVCKCMYSLDPTGIAMKKINDNQSRALGCLVGFSDIIPIAAPMMRQPGSTVIRLPDPAEGITGPLTFTEGFVVFRHRLDQFIALPQYTEQPSLPVPPMMLQVQRRYRDLRSAFPEWEDEALAKSQANNHSIDFLSACGDCWSECTRYFEALNGEHGKYLYRDLMAVHLKNAVNWQRNARDRLEAGTVRENYGLRDLNAEGMHLYWDYLELVVEELWELRWMGVRKEKLREAWVVMIFRAFCWSRSHWMSEGTGIYDTKQRLPSHYYAEEELTKDYEVEDEFISVLDESASDASLH
ncbi:MAG: hypothetical protein Q9179_007956 [Wetmoreana sp. 5 TL-2023]